METIQAATQDFILYIRKELNDAADLHFESTAGGKVTIVYLSSVVNQREIEADFLEPLGRIGVAGNAPELQPDWERLLAAIPAHGMDV